MGSNAKHKYSPFFVKLKKHLVCDFFKGNYFDKRNNSIYSVIFVFVKRTILLSNILILGATGRLHIGDWREKCVSYSKCSFILSHNSIRDAPSIRPFLKSSSEVANA